MGPEGVSLPLRCMENMEGHTVGVPVVEGQFQTWNSETYVQAQSSSGTLASSLDCSGPPFSYVEHGEGVQVEGGCRKGPCTCLQWGWRLEHLSGG